MKRLFLFMVMVFGYGLIAQTISNVEYYFDTDPGFGNGNPLTVSANTGTLEQSFDISTSALTGGLHILFIRALDDDAKWSHYDAQLFYIAKKQNANLKITTAEYYFDEDPGFDSGTSISVPNQSSFTTVIGIPQNLGVGIHKLFIRVKTEENLWSHYDQKLIYVSPNHDDTVVEYEYFIDTDDDVIPVAVTNPNNQVISDIDTNGLSQGTHYFYIRAKNSDGTYSMYDVEEFNVDGFLSISENDFNSISLYPNPVSKSINVSSTQHFIMKQLTVYDTMGKTVLKTTKNTKKIDLGMLESGIYILNLNTNLGSASYKIIKE